MLRKKDVHPARFMPPSNSLMRDVFILLTVKIMTLDEVGIDHTFGLCEVQLERNLKTLVSQANLSLHTRKIFL